ncbi:hypothetical protein AGMMS49936_06550 [Endomicrobiia bacterium]|nr:hypothetical protein AGMMS49936_06550 [Endomicrobiia bacterium]
MILMSATWPKSTMNICACRSGCAAAGDDEGELLEDALDGDDNEDDELDELLDELDEDELVVCGGGNSGGGGSSSS